MSKGLRKVKFRNRWQFRAREILYTQRDAKYWFLDHDGTGKDDILTQVTPIRALKVTRIFQNKYLQTMTEVAQEIDLIKNMIP